MALHRLIAEATGDTLLQRILDMLNGRIARVRMVNSPRRFHRSRREHLAIVAALRSGHPEAAAEAMGRHLASPPCGDP